jgi:hypothetical protein
MLRSMKFEEVPLAAVAFEDETFRISEDLKILQMSASLLAVGQVCPVVLLEGTESSRFTILCGFRRLHALRSIGSDQVVARLLKAANDDKLLLFLKALWDNLSHRQLIPLEAARTLFVLKTVCRVEEDILVQRFLPLLGLSPHRNVLHSHLHLHRLHPELRRLLNAGQISLASAERLAPAAPEIQAQISRLLGSIRLSASLQRQVLDLAEDLAAINYLTMGDFLSRPEIIAVAEDARLTPFQRGEQVYDLLYRQRYPRLTRTREQFQSERANLELPGDIRISGDPFFESPRLHVEFDVTSARAFREAVAALEVSCTKASLDRLFEVS